MNAAEFVASYFKAWNKQDSRAIADHLAENGTYLDIPVHQHMSREQLIAHLNELFKLETNIYELTGEVLAGKNTIAFQYKVFPRAQDKDSKGSDSKGSDTWFGAEFITLHDGVAIEIVDYYDQNGLEAPRSPLASATGESHLKRYAKSGLGSLQMAAVKKQLSELMNTDKLYLRADLTLPELAQALDCSVNHLSQAINAGFGVSFFDYLNECRVKDAMHLLREDGNEARTVLDVALDVGFNSTSTFYVAFKKVTGETPAQYRRDHTEQTGSKADP
jgi:AraC-like DNA-binding protein